jgi:hypothetical protein
LVDLAVDRGPDDVVVDVIVRVGHVIASVLNVAPRDLGMATLDGVVEPAHSCRQVGHDLAGGLAENLARIAFEELLLPFGCDLAGDAGQVRDVVGNLPCAMAALGGPSIGGRRGG